MTFLKTQQPNPKHIFRKCNNKIENKCFPSKKCCFVKCYRLSVMLFFVSFIRSGPPYFYGLLGALSQWLTPQCLSLIFWTFFWLSWKYKNHIKSTITIESNSIFPPKCYFLKSHSLPGLLLCTYLFIFLTSGPPYFYDHFGKLLEQQTPLCLALISIA